MFKTSVLEGRNDCSDGRKELKEEESGWAVLSSYFRRPNKKMYLKCSMNKHCVWLNVSMNHICISQVYISSVSKNKSTTQGDVMTVLWAVAETIRSNLSLSAFVIPNMMIYLNRTQIMWVQLLNPPLLTVKWMWTDVIVWLVCASRRGMCVCVWDNELSVWVVQSLQPAGLANLTPCTRQLLLCHINKGGAWQKKTEGKGLTRAREKKKETGRTNIHWIRKQDSGGSKQKRWSSRFWAVLDRCDLPVTQLGKDPANTMPVCLSFTINALNTLEGSYCESANDIWSAEGDLPRFVLEFVDLKDQSVY